MKYVIYSIFLVLLSLMTIGDGYAGYRSIIISHASIQDDALGHMDVHQVEQATANSSGHIERTNYQTVIGSVQLAADHHSSHREAGKFFLLSRYLSFIDTKQHITILAANGQLTNHYKAPRERLLYPHHSFW